MSRNTQSALNDLLWERIAEILNERGQKYADLWRLVPRNKNTYTSWTKRRIIPSVADVEELAAALGVQAVELLSPTERLAPSHEQPFQLQLPFEPGSKGVKIELQATTLGFALKLLRTA
jgi:hypothetical protein